MSTDTLDATYGHKNIPGYHNYWNPSKNSMETNSPPGDYIFDCAFTLDGYNYELHTIYNVPENVLKTPEKLAQLNSFRAALLQFVYAWIDSIDAKSSA